MIDDPVKTEQLIADLKAVLPIECRPTDIVIRALTKDAPDRAPPTQSMVTNISYAGDEGGIMCGLSSGEPDARAHYISITHLGFDRRLPMFRRIDSYQRRRIKKIRRQAGATINTKLP